MRRSVEIPVFRDPHGNPVRATIAFFLTDLSGRRITGVDESGDPIVDYRQIISGDEPTSIDLTPTDQISPPSQYRIDIATPLGRSRHIAQVESGDAELTWAELIALPAGVASGEILSNRLLPDPTQLPDDYAAIVRGGRWIGTSEIPTLAGVDGREIEVRAYDGQLQTRYVGGEWSSIYDLAQLRGESVEIGVDSGSIAYRAHGETQWIPIYPLSSLQGPQGSSVELSLNSTHIIWRHSGDAQWSNLVALSAITGADGSGVTILGSLSVEGDLPESGAPGDAYLIDGDLWVLTAGEWVNAGRIQGPTGKSVELSRVSDNIVWRNTGDELWTVLLPLADIRGDTGERGASPQMRVASGQIQYRITGDETWTTLLTFADITPGLAFSSEGNMRYGGALGAPTEFATTTDGRALLGATTAQAKDILGIPDDLVFGAVTESGDDLIFGAANA